MNTISRTRYDVALWDCGCLTWTENNEFTYLPCGQALCRVENIVMEVLKEENKKLIRLEVKRREVDV